MTRYNAGEKVGKGTYWNISNGNRVDIPDEGILPGGDGSKYSRLRPAIMVLAGPVIGLFYVIAMPFIAVGTIVVMIGAKLLSGLFNLLGNLVSFGWRPSEAHLAGKKGKKKDEKT
jgi:hypothetical protein